MGEPIDNLEYAARLARAIAADLALYNEERIRRGREQGDVYGAVKTQIEEGLALYLERVTERVAAMGLFEDAIKEVLLGAGASAPLPPPVSRRAPTPPVPDPRPTQPRSRRRSASYGATSRVRREGPKGNSGGGKYRTIGKSAKYKSKAGNSAGGLWFGMVLVIGAVGALVYYLLQ